MRFHLSVATLSLAMLLVGGIACSEAQQAQQAAGWHAPTDNADRYGSGGASPASSATNDTAPRPISSYGSPNAAVAPIGSTPPRPPAPNRPTPA